MSIKCFMISSGNSTGRTVNFQPASFDYFIDEYREFFTSNQGVQQAILYQKFSEIYPGVTLLGMEQIRRVVNV